MNCAVLVINLLPCHHTISVCNWRNFMRLHISYHWLSAQWWLQVFLPAGLPAGQTPVVGLLRGPFYGEIWRDVGLTSPRCISPTVQGA